MSLLFFKIVIIGMPFGLSLMWFAYWVVKIYKAQRKVKAGMAPTGGKDKSTVSAPVPSGISRAKATPRHGAAKASSRPVRRSGIRSRRSGAR